MNSKALYGKMLSTGPYLKDGKAPRQPSPEEAAIARQLQDLGLTGREAAAAAIPVARIRRRSAAVAALSEALRSKVPEALQLPVEIRPHPDSGDPCAWLGGRQLRLSFGGAESVLERWVLEECAASAPGSCLEDLEEEDLDSLPRAAQVDPAAWAQAVQRISRAAAMASLQSAARRLDFRAVVDSGVSKGELADMFAQAWDRAQCQDVHEGEPLSDAAEYLTQAAAADKAAI